jgi:hypothetical protein
MEPIYSAFGLQYVAVRVGSLEIPLQAAQDASFEAKQDVVELMGDNATSPLDVQPKKLTVTTKGKFAQVGFAALNALTGGQEVSYSAGSILPTQEETGGCSMANAIASQTVTSASAMLTQGWNFVANSPTTYSIVRSSDAVVLGPFSVSSYPNTTAISGVSFIVNSTLTQGSWASFQTVGPLGSVETNQMGKADFPSQVSLRMITESPPGEGQIEIFIPKAQPLGCTITEKTKEFATLDFEFRGLFDPLSGKIFQMRKYDRPLTAC